MRYLPLILSCLMLAAHHSRAGQPGLIGLWLTVPLILWIKRRWADVVLQLLMAAGAGVWVASTLHYVHIRQALGMPYGRLVAILVTVAFITLGSGLVLNRKGRRAVLPDHDPVGAGLGAFLVTAALLAPVQLFMHPAGLLAERYLPFAGWWEAVVLGLYAGWLSDRLRDARQIRRLRPRVWFAFSVIFFTQLILGLAGVDRMLMTGKLHLPVPAMIVAGPLFRGGGLFMAILFSVSVLLVGPAWCSWLCYFGAWDNRAALARKHPTPLPPWRNALRLGILIGIAALAWVFGRLGLPSSVAAALGGGFGILGVGVMLHHSRRRGTMVHCTSFCPIGWLATRLGRLSPWRIRIDTTCTECMACTLVCRYDALHPAHVRARRVGEACTLCGDCVTACQKTWDIHYTFFGLEPERARRAFLTLVAALHAAFLGIAMI